MCHMPINYVSIQTDSLPVSIPDAPAGLRYCTFCEDFLPVKNFSNAATFCCNGCKTHSWQILGKRAQEKHMQHAKITCIRTLWRKCYADSKLFLSTVTLGAESRPDKICSSGHARVEISEREIQHLLQGMIEMFSLSSSMCAYENLRQLGKKFAIVPISPTQVISLSNACLVSSSVKRDLLKALKTNGCEGYLQALRWADTHRKTVYKPSADKLSEMISQKMTFESDPI